jgi:pimeloyl-ACP methyl ester carboxylesterase
MTVTGTDGMFTVESADGTPVACWRHGSGPPLVLVHGTGEDHNRWRLIGARLARRFTVHAMDRRGRGGSGDCDPYRMELEAADLLAVIGRAGPPGTVAVVAHSYGAICAVQAARRGAGLGPMVLYEPPVPVPGAPDYSGAAAALRTLTGDGQHELALARFLTDIAGVAPEYVFRPAAGADHPARRRLAATLAREIEATHGYRLEAGGPPRAGAVLVLAGGASPEPRQRAAAMVAQAFPGGRLGVLAGQGHDAIDASPRQFLDAVLGFLPGEQR